MYKYHEEQDEEDELDTLHQKMDSGEELVIDEKTEDTTFDQSAFNFNYTDDYWLNDGYHKEHSEQ